MAVAHTLYTPNNAAVLEEVSREAANLHRFPVSVCLADCWESQGKSSAVMSIILLYFEDLIHSVQKIWVKEDKKKGQACTGEARGHQRTAKNTRSSSDTSQVYGISLSALLTHLKTNESIEQQALQGDILKQIGIHGSNCGNKENWADSLIMPCSKENYCNGRQNGKCNGWWIRPQGDCWF